MQAAGQVIASRTGVDQARRTVSGVVLRLRNKPNAQACSLGSDYTHLFAITDPTTTRYSALSQVSKLHNHTSCFQTIESRPHADTLPLTSLLRNTSRAATARRMDPSSCRQGAVAYSLHPCSSCRSIYTSDLTNRMRCLVRWRMAGPPCRSHVPPRCRICQHP